MKSTNKILIASLFILNLAVGANAAQFQTATKLYWKEFAIDKIQRSELDGSNPQDLITSGVPGRGDIDVDVLGGKMCWSDEETDKIQCSNLDGSNVEDLNTGLGNPKGVSFDLANNRLYWTEEQTGVIGRIDLDGSGAPQAVLTNRDQPFGIDIDQASGKMYWTEELAGFEAIYRANLDGSGIETLLTGSLVNAPRGIALDPSGGKMYWLDSGLDRIRRANLDGTNPETVITSAMAPAGIDQPRHIALDVVAGKVYWSDEGPPNIYKANLDGTNVVELAVGDKAFGIALDNRIPEPSTVVLATLSMLCMGWRPRKRK